jgi:RNA polymerase sigma-70 factor (ECF subfamily)
MDVQEVKYRVERVRTGDREAFSWIVNQYKDLVYTLCVRMLANEDDAADATQEVFLKAYRSIDSFREKSKFSTWIYRIAYNHCISEIRKKVKVIDLVDEVQENETGVHEADGLEHLSREERRNYLQQALDALPETDAVVVTLFYYEELSLEEIEEVTGLSSGNIRIRLHRSRKKLWKVLNELLQSEINSIV